MSSFTSIAKVTAVNVEVGAAFCRKCPTRSSDSRKFEEVGIVTVKKELIQALEQVSETELVKVLEFVRSLPAAPLGQSLKSNSTQSNANPVWQAYLESKREREEVYRRLANS